ncbi:L-2-amino-thiazoline-4-carboxylic acid hydrolase [Actinophytocola sp.]|uniref:L-2-amino-thiazoline-4-carboxylic acid hydrolase n=1 Tax=Actinophytocola sp. TaxID=1872138 RepID=UPI002ED48DAF
MTTDHYVPDPEAETAALVEAFLEHLDVSASRRADIQARHEKLVAANQHLVVDDLARHSLRLTLVVAAAYELLRPSLGQARAMAAVEAALVEPLAPFVRAATRAMLDHAPDPYQAMVEMAKSRETESFGAGFEFRHAVDDGERFHQDVHRCHYHDVLVANGMAELTPALCAFDRNWIDVIDPARHGFRFDRETTIGTGGTHCPFHFTRVR